MRKCKNCNSDVYIGKPICRNCGKDIEAEDEEFRAINAKVKKYYNLERIVIFVTLFVGFVLYLVPIFRNDNYGITIAVMGSIYLGFHIVNSIFFGITTTSSFVERYILFKEKPVYFVAYIAMSLFILIVLVSG